MKIIVFIDKELPKKEAMNLSGSKLIFVCAKAGKIIFSIATLKKKNGFCTLDLTCNPFNFQAWGHFDPSELQGIWRLLSSSDKGRSAINIKFRRKVKLLKSITLTISMLNKSIVIQTSAEEKEKEKGAVAAVLADLFMFDKVFRSKLKQVNNMIRLFE